MCVVRNCCSTGVYQVSIPLQSGTKILGVLSPSVVPATVTNPNLPESQEYLSQMITLLGRCPEL